MVSNISLKDLGWETTPFLIKDGYLEFNLISKPLQTSNGWVRYLIFNTDRLKPGVNSGVDRNVLLVDIGKRVIRDNDFSFTNFILEEFLIGPALDVQTVVNNQNNNASIYNSSYYYFNGLIGNKAAFEIKDKYCWYTNGSPVLTPGTKTMAVSLIDNTLKCRAMKYNFEPYQIWFKGEFPYNVDNDYVIYQDDDYKIYISHIDGHLKLDRTAYTGFTESFVIQPFSHTGKHSLLNVCIQEYQDKFISIVNGKVSEFNGLMELKDKFSFENQMEVIYKKTNTFASERDYSVRCDRCLNGNYYIRVDVPETYLNLDIDIYLNRNYWLKVVEQTLKGVDDDIKVINEREYYI